MNDEDKIVLILDSENILNICAFSKNVFIKKIKIHVNNKANFVFWWNFEYFLQDKSIKHQMFLKLKFKAKVLNRMHEIKTLRKYVLLKHSQL